MGDLNGGYYGPAIPPSRPYRRRSGSGGGGCCCCCNPLTCLCGCLLKCICTCVCQIVITVLVIAAIAGFVFWLIFRPNAVKFHASDASLTEFNLVNGTLRYNLALNLTIRNPNSRIGIYYDRIEARASYLGQRFSTVDLPPLYQGRKSTDNATAVFRGQQEVLLGKTEMSKYEDDQSARAYGIDVKLYLRIRLKFWFVKSGVLKPKINCDLRIPLASNGTVSGVYEPKRCDFVWR